MPQLTQLMLVYQSQWFWLLLVLGAIYVFVGRGIVTKVEATVDDRDAKIASDLAAAGLARSEASKTEDRWRTQMDSARADARDSEAKAKASAAAAAEKRIAKAEAEIADRAEQASAKLAAMREAAKSVIEEAAADATRDIVAKLTGMTVSAADARRAVTGVLNHG